MRRILIVPTLLTACSGAPAPTPEPRPAERSQPPTTSTANPPASPGPAAASPSPDAATENTPASSWIEEAVQEALWQELVPGTSGDPDPARAAPLRAFFAEHPEYRDRTKRSALWKHACGLGSTEAAHRHLTAPAPRTPLTIEVAGDRWKVLVIHASNHCTSDDWGYYSFEASEAASKHGASVTHASVENDSVVIQSGGETLLTHPLSGQGYLVVQQGSDARDLGYDPGAPGAVGRYFATAAQPGDRP